MVGSAHPTIVIPPRGLFAGLIANRAIKGSGNLSKIFSQRQFTRFCGDVF